MTAAIRDEGSPLPSLVPCLIVSEAQVSCVRVYLRETPRSSAAQQRALAEAVYRERWAPAGYDLASYQDTAAAYSQLLAQREAGKEVILDLEQGDVFLVASSAATFKCGKDVSATLSRLAARGVLIHLIDLNVDTSSPEGANRLELLLQAEAAERRRGSERLTWHHRIQRREGRPHGATPFGLKVIGPPGRRRYIKDAWERRCAKKFFDLHQQGFSYDALFFWALRNKVRRTNGREWSRSVIHLAVQAAPRFEEEDSKARRGRTKKPTPETSEPDAAAGSHVETTTST